MTTSTQQPWPCGQGQLDPQAEKYLQALAQLNGPPLQTKTPQQARADRIASGQANAGLIERVAHIEDRLIPGPAGELPIRIYMPDDSSAPLPVLVFFHGGGWVTGNIDTHDPLCRSLAKRAGCLVVSVDYRLAPEHKHPAAVEDAYAATVWVADYAAQFGGDPDRVAVGGDSAGGQLATAATILARENNRPKILHQLLIYPVTNTATQETDSYLKFAEGLNLTREGMIWFRNHYIAAEADAQDPYASPLLARDLSHLPPATVITAEFDVLHDEGRAYAERLAAAGVPVSYRCYGGMLHGFVTNAGVMDRAYACLDDMAETLRHVFA
ncbi:MAG: alpha/beta hydrolase [Anaerolineae bacterium]|nr:alpha/beta hydrolase [Anaerolineae bacterium]